MKLGVTVHLHIFTLDYTPQQIAKTNETVGGALISFLLFTVPVKHIIEIEINK